MQEESTNERDLTYSAWHRRQSTARFVGIEKAQTLAMIDCDVVCFVEYDDRTKVPVALIETAIDVGQKVKPSSVTKNLAKMAGIPAGVLLYTQSDNPNPAYPKHKDIESFRFQQIWPAPLGNDWQLLTPSEWAQKLLAMREYGGRQVFKAQTN